MVDCTKSFYEILGIASGATPDEIKSAYKKLVRIYHPDVNKNPDAEIQFKLFNSAYSVLSDENRRKNYDILLKNKEKTKESYFKIDNNSIIKEIKITEKEANEGTTRTVNILNTQKCPKCMGKKFINGIKCAFCFGEGEKGELKKIDVEIKKGIEEGEFVYVGKVNTSALYDKKLFLCVSIEKAKKLYFEGNDVTVHVEIPFYDAILGIEKEINIEPFGLISFNIPPLTKPNSKIKLEIEGEKANYYATIDVIFPSDISFEEKKLYDKIRLINIKKTENERINKRNF